MRYMGALVLFSFADAAYKVGDCQCPKSGRL